MCKISLEGLNSKVEGGGGGERMAEFHLELCNNLYIFKILMNYLS